MFKGVGTALITPFKTDGSLDEAAVETLQIGGETRERGARARLDDVGPADGGRRRSLGRHRPRRRSGRCDLGPRRHGRRTRAVGVGLVPALRPPISLAR